MATADHNKRLAAWMDQHQKASANYQAPKLLYLAEVHWEDDLANARCPGARSVCSATNG